jgi:hypothetical protein
MPIDPNIALQTRPVQIESPANALARAMQIQNMGQQNQMNALQMQDMHAQRAAQLQAQQAKQAGFQSFVQGLPPPDPNDPRQMALHAALVNGQLDPKDALSQLFPQRKVARTVEIKGPDGKPYTVQMDEQGNPMGQNLPKWVAPHFQSLGDRVEAIDPTAIPAVPLRIGQSPDSVASQQTAIRGQNMVDARAREATGVAQAQGKVPAGYRQTADGNLEAIKGGPADLKLQGTLNADTQALGGTMSSLDRLAVSANEVLNAPGLASVYGLRGAVPNIPGTAAADAAALLNTLKSQVGFGVLQDMRNNSKTGGALGAVSDKENAMLQANLAALEKSQSVEQAQASLKKIIEYTDAAKGRLRDAYNMKHGSAPVAKPAASGGWTVEKQ